MVIGNQFVVVTVLVLEKHLVFMLWQLLYQSWKIKIETVRHNLAVVKNIFAVITLAARKFLKVCRIMDQQKQQYASILAIINENEHKKLTPSMKKEVVNVPYYSSFDLFSPFADALYPNSPCFASSADSRVQYWCTKSMYRGMSKVPLKKLHERFTYAIRTETKIFW